MPVNVIAGIDMGGTNTSFGLVDANGKIISRDSIPTRTYNDPAELVTNVYKRLDEMCGKESSLMAIGLGAPSGNYFSGSIEHAPNMPWTGIVPMADMFSELSGRPCLLTNDANAAALGEMIFGGAKDVKDFLFITLGTGLGSGIVSNGQLIYGYGGQAGEIGHVLIEKDGRLCGCGRRGCLETYCSATGLVATYKGITKPETHKHGESSMNCAKEICERAKAGEKEARDAFRITGEKLGLALANSVCYTGPQVVFLFGGVAAAGDLILNPTRESLEKNLLHIYRGKVELRLSSLHENEAAILGAASLVSKYLQS
jgi:glucokinase